MKRKKLSTLLCIGLLTLVLVALPLVGSCAKPAPAPEAEAEIWLNIATSGVGTSGYESAATLCRLVDIYHPNIHLLAVPVRIAGSRHRLVEEGKADIVYDAPRGLHDAYQNAGVFEEKPLTWRVLYGLNISAGSMFWCTKKESDINTMNDFVGKKVCLSSGGNMAVATQILKDLGLWDKCEPRGVAYADIPDALATGAVDVTLTYMSSGGLALSGWVRDMLSRIEIKPIILTEKEKEVIGAIPGLVIDDIPTDIIKKEQPFPVDSVPCWLMFFGYHYSPDISADHVYNITKILFEHGEEAAEMTAGGFKLMRTFDSAKHINKLGLNAVKGVCPVHPGAVRYYKEIGIWDESYSEGKLKSRP